MTITGLAVIQDGDTFEIGPLLIRLNGIDAPEAGQTCVDPKGGTWPCGDHATARLAAVTDGQSLTCEGLDRDPYGRVIATCHVNGQDIGAALVAEGSAWAYRDYTDVYAALEDEARGRAVGIWSAINQTPTAYRADRWNRAAAASPRPGCPIKGNISRGGEHIYHTPWSPAYSRTRIDARRGEAWFCDEAEAIQAGWRAARWR